MLVRLALVVCLLAGCTMPDPPPPSVAPPGPEDLSTWATPELVPLPQRAPARPVVPTDHKPTAAEKVYAYTPGETYTVPVSLGFPLDIVFARGEAVHNVTDGDRAPQDEGQTRRWEVRQGKEGQGAEERHHVFVTVTAPGLRNGLIITTTQRTLYVTLESVAKSPIRVLRWKEDPNLEIRTAAPVEGGPLPDLTTPARWRVGYQLTTASGTAPDWLPRQVVDDGRKIYILFPEAVLFGVVPLVRVVGPTGPLLVNARQYLNILIVDQLFARAELRLGTGETAEVVTIQRGPLRIVECPTETAVCPRWPAAAFRFQGDPA